MHFFRDFKTLNSLGDTATSSQSAATRRRKVYDPPSRRNYVIDTGVKVLVFLFPKHNKLFTQQLKLAAANFTPITTYDYRQKDTGLRLCRTFSWRFIWICNIGL